MARTQDQMIVDLTNLLSLARRGQLNAFGFVALTKEQMFYRANAEGHSSKLELLGAFRRMEIHIDDLMYEEELQHEDWTEEQANAALEAPEQLN